MSKIPKSDLINGIVSDVEHVRRIIDALDGSAIRDIYMTGSLNISGSVQVSGNVVFHDDLKLEGIISDGLELDHGTRINEFSIDGVLGGDSDNAIPTEKATKTYVDNQVSIVTSGSVAGTGVAGYVPIWTSTVIQNTSSIFESSSLNYVGMGTTEPKQKLHVVGNISASEFHGDGSNITGIISSSYSVTSSYAVSASHVEFADDAYSASFAATASFLTGLIESASYSTTASFAQYSQNAYDYSSSFETRISENENTGSVLWNASESFSTRVSTNETDISNLQTDSASFSDRISENEDTGSVLWNASESFSTRVSTNEVNINNLQTDSASFSDRVTENENTGSVLWNASESFSTRVSTNEVDISNLQTDSASFSDRITENEDTGSYLWNASESFSTRVSTNEVDINNLQTDSASFSDRITENENTGSVLWNASESFSTRVSTNEVDINNLQTDSASFSDRVTENENTGSYLWNASESFSTRVSTNEVHIEGLLSPTASYATTGSNTFIGDQIITGNVSASGYISSSQLAGDLNLTYVKPRTNAYYPDYYYKNVNGDQYLSKMFSAGQVSGSAFSQSVDTVHIQAGRAVLRDANNVSGILYITPILSASCTAFPTKSVTFIGVEWSGNNTEATYVSKSTDTWNYNLDYPLITVVEEADTLFSFENPHEINDGMNNVNRRFLETDQYARADESGLIIGESGDGNRHFTLTAGDIWHSLHKDHITAKDTAVSSTFNMFRTDPTGNWVLDAGKTQWDNDIFDTGTGTASLQPNRFTNLWWYLGVKVDGVGCLYDTAQYTSLALAEAATPPGSIPLNMQYGGKLLGRFIVQQGTTTALTIQSVFTTTFGAAAAADHGNLSGLTDDDHTQYILVDGTRDFEGTSSYALTADSASYYDGSVVSASHSETSDNAISASHSETSDNAISSSYAITASYYDGSVISASHSETSDNAISSSYAITASYYDGSIVSASHAIQSDNAISSSYAVTASYAVNGGGTGAGGSWTGSDGYISRLGDVQITGSLIVTETGSFKQIIVSQSANLWKEIDYAEGFSLKYLDYVYTQSATELANTSDGNVVSQIDYYDVKSGNKIYQRDFTYADEIVTTESITRQADSVSQTVVYTYTGSLVLTKEFK